MYPHEMILDTFGIQQLANARLLVGFFFAPQQLRSRSARLLLLWSGPTWTVLFVVFFVGCLAFFWFFNDQNEM